MEDRLFFPDIICCLVELVDKPPWTHQTKDGKIVRYTEAKWCPVHERETMAVTKTEAQVAQRRLFFPQQIHLFQGVAGTSSLAHGSRVPTKVQLQRSQKSDCIESNGTSLFISFTTRF